MFCTASDLLQTHLEQAQAQVGSLHLVDLLCSGRDDSPSFTRSSETQRRIPAFGPSGISYPAAHLLQKRVGAGCVRMQT